MELKTIGEFENYAKEIVAIEEEHRTDPQFRGREPLSSKDVLVPYIKEDEYSYSGIFIGVSYSAFLYECTYNKNTCQFYLEVYKRIKSLPEY